MLNRISHLLAFLELMQRCMASHVKDHREL